MHLAPGGREAQARARARNPGEAGDRAHGGLRLHRALAGGRGQRPARRRRRPTAGRSTGNRPGTVGLPLPGTAIKTTDPETGADLPRGTEGIVRVKGPQVMVGYLNRPEATAEVAQGRLVHHGRPRLPRRRRVPQDHRPAQPVLEDRRRDGAPHGGRVGDHRGGRGGPSGASPSRRSPTRSAASGCS